MNKVIALLPMKGNSERVPNKNLKDFCGLPLYHRVLKELLNSKYISDVIINTDSKAIIDDVNKNFSNRVIINDRPKNIQGDFVSMNKVIEYDILNYPAEIYVQTHSTNPLIKSESIDKALEKMTTRDGKFDSIFSVTKIQTRLYDDSGFAVNHNPKKLLRTQDLPPLYEENSNFFIFTKESFFENGRKRIGKTPIMFEIDKLEAIDIDEPQDFIIAEALYKLLR